MTYIPQWTINGLVLTDSPFMVEQNASDPGVGDTVSAILASQIADGDIELTQRRGNRVYELSVLIEGGDRATIATAQAALVAAVEQARGTLEFDPGDESDVTVFETFAGSVALSNGTDDEAADAGLQRLKVTIPCRPFVRPVSEVTIDAPPVVGSTTNPVDTGSSTTGWSVLSTAPASVTNVETNPDLKTNVTGYTAGGGSSAVTWVNEASHTTAQVNTPTGANGESFINGPLHVVAPGNSVLIGSVISTSAFHAAPFMTVINRVRFYSNTTGTTQIGTDTVLTASGGDWATRTWSVTAPAGAIRMRVFRGQKQLPTASSDPWYLDKQWTVITPAGAVAPGTGYWDGATTDTSVLQYNWTGTANASTSTATWSNPTLAVVSGAVRGTVYGRSSALIRRTGSVTMTSLPYMRITGQASAFSDGRVTIADNGVPVTPASYSYNATTGAFEILINRPDGFTAIDIAFARTGGAVSTTSGIFVAADNIEITDNPFGTGKTQSRQVQIYGSQRTELSLAILGLDVSSNPTALGEQVLIHTATAGSDGRAKFLACRATSGATAGATTDSTASSGFYNALGTTASPTEFPFDASLLLPGQYVAYARVKGAAAVTRSVSFNASLDGAGALDASDPVSGWYSTQVALTTTWRIVPLGFLMLPPANIEDPAATLTVRAAADVATVVRLDEIWVAHVESGQVTLLDTNNSGISAVRLDAATVEASEPSAWVGVATASGTGTMMAAGSRILAFDQHMAEPGLLQISTVTPGCSTSRVSARYFPRYAHDVAPLPTA